MGIDLGPLASVGAIHAREALRGSQGCLSSQKIGIEVLAPMIAFTLGRTFNRELRRVVGER